MTALHFILALIKEINEDTISISIKYLSNTLKYNRITHTFFKIKLY